MVKAKKDQYTVVLEDIRDKFKVFGESLQFVRDDIKEMKKTQSSQTEMIGQLMVDMTEVKNGLKSKVSQEDFAKLERRVVRLETKVK